MKMTCISHPLLPPSSMYGEIGSEWQGDREGVGWGLTPVLSCLFSLLESANSIHLWLRHSGGHVTHLPFQRQGSAVCGGRWAISHLCRSTQKWPELLDSLPSVLACKEPSIWGLTPHVLPSGRSVSLSSGRVVLIYLLSPLLPLPFSFLPL